MQAAGYGDYARTRVKVAELESERTALLKALAKHEDEFYGKWPGGLRPASPWPEPSLVTEMDVPRAGDASSADPHSSDKQRLAALRHRLIEVETQLKRSQVDLLREEDRVSARESLRRAFIKARQILPLLVVSLGILALAQYADGVISPQGASGAPKTSATPAAPTQPDPTVSAPTSAPPRLSRQEELRQREKSDSQARVHCLDKLIHDPGAALVAGCGQAAVAVSIRGPRAVPADSKPKGSEPSHEVVSEWRFPSALELRQSALLESTLEALEKNEERKSFQKTWAAISVPLQVVSVFGALVAIALLIAELARGAGFHWNPEEFVKSRLAPAKDGDGGSAKSLPGSSAGPLLMALLGTLPLLIMVALALMIVGWSSWRALAPPDLSQVIPIANRITLQAPAFPQAASAPINVTVSAKQIDDNTETLQRQLALLTQAGEQSERSAKASIAWLDKVQKGADSSVAVFGQAASAARSLGQATAEIQGAAGAVQKSAAAIGAEAARAAGFYTEAARKMDENAIASAKRAKDDEIHLQRTHGYLLEFAKYMKENKWERSREPPTGRN